MNCHGKAYLASLESPEDSHSVGGKWTLGDEAPICEDEEDDEDERTAQLRRLDSTREVLKLCLSSNSFDYLPVSEYLHSGETDDCESEGNTELEKRRSRSNSSRHRYDVVTDLGPEEVRWFYKEDRKTWKPFIGYDSLRLELAFRKYGVLNPPKEEQVETADSCRSESPDVCVEPVCVRGGLYEVNIKEKECYPVYWHQSDTIPVMRGQWFIDGTWQPLEEEDSDLIEQEHLSCFKGQQTQDTFDMDIAKPVDSKDVFYHHHLPPFNLHFLFKWRGFEERRGTACLKRKRCEAIHSLKLSRNHVDWHSVDEVYLYSDATTSKIARTVTQKLGFSKASSSGTRLHRGYVEEATLEDQPPQTSHIVFVVHGIGQKMDQGRIIKNTGMMREAARKMEEKHFSDRATEHVEFLPVEWRSKLGLDGDTVESITPDKVRGLRDMLNSSAMDIMYYTSPLYRNEVNLIALRVFPPFYFRLKELEERLHGIEASQMTKQPALKFKVENFFCMGSPLAVFLALRGIRPGNNCSQDHILPKTVCKRLFNIFHPTDPVAYRLEPLILKHYSSVAAVQIHWYNTTNPTRYDHIKPSLLNPSKETTSISDTESIPSPCTSPVLNRRHYGESITNIGKAGILGAASIGKGLGGMLFSRFARSSAGASQTTDTTKESGEDEDKKSVTSQSSTGTQTLPHSISGPLDTKLELEHRIDYELREGLVESRYWSAVTSHTAYWSSLDVALFLLTFMYRQEEDENTKESREAVE
ncbi:phospholipase DDHD1 [Protopterus annectens]|uniref:phospholipase DDHD1 n=1 Tax=Protopterus annectens TaxID=7888 RepID=UPI001CFB2836|nr:phospholipase DDHD1 [Protopterus annectens]